MERRSAACRTALAFGQVAARTALEAAAVLLRHGRSSPADVMIITAVHACHAAGN
jgi:hypothetical protein